MSWSIKGTSSPRRNISIQKYRGGRSEKSFLDVGCGEGYALKSFHADGWSVAGIDFSDFGIAAHNPDMKEFLQKGDLMKIIDGAERTFGFINMDNVLEHLPDAGQFLSVLKKVCAKESVICITVPNDFSVTQQTLYRGGCIEGAFWVSKESSEHFNYFTMDSLTAFVEKSGFEVVWQSADYPIDFNLFNPLTNYVRDKSVGHEGHVAHLKIENMLYKKSLENTVMLHHAYAKCGVGRDISIYMKIKQ